MSKSKQKRLLKVTHMGNERFIFGYCFTNVLVWGCEGEFFELLTFFFLLTFECQTFIHLLLIGRVQFCMELHLWFLCVYVFLRHQGYI